jgi:hypothetical protein
MLHRSNQCAGDPDALPVLVVENERAVKQRGERAGPGRDRNRNSGRSVAAAYGGAEDPGVRARAYRPVVWPEADALLV